MSQKTLGFYKFFSYPIFYSLTQKIMSGESKREKIIDYAYILADKHSYDKRVESLFMQLELL